MARGNKKRIFLPVDELRRLYIDELWSAAQIASHFDCTPPPVFAAMKEAGIPVRKVGNCVRPKPPRVGLPIIEITELYLVKMWSIERIAERFGCSGPTVATRLRRANVSIRACNDTKRGAVSPLRAKPAVSDIAIVMAYKTRPHLSIKELARLGGTCTSAITRILDTHGVPHKTLSQVIGDTRNGPANPNWRDDLTDEERLNRRDNAKQVAWRNEVFKRDRFTCQSCKDADGGNLNGHHIESYNANRTLRWEVSNGITLCETCHLAFHKRFGYGDNNAAQLAEFLQGERQAA
jgi:hypothetical protein